MRRVLLLASAMVFLDLTFFTAIAPLLPTYKHDLGLSTAQAGILSAAYAAGTLAFSLPGGYIASRFGPRRTVISGLFVVRRRHPPLRLPQVGLAARRGALHPGHRQRADLVRRADLADQQLPRGQTRPGDRQRAGDGGRGVAAGAGAGLARRLDRHRNHLRRSLRRRPRPRLPGLARAGHRRHGEPAAARGPPLHGRPRTGRGGDLRQLAVADVRRDRRAAAAADRQPWRRARADRGRLRRRRGDRVGALADRRSTFRQGRPARAVRAGDGDLRGGDAGLCGRRFPADRGPRAADHRTRLGPLLRPGDDADLRRRRSEWPPSGLRGRGDEHGLGGGAGASAASPARRSPGRPGTPLRASPSPSSSWRRSSTPSAR